MTTRTIIKNVVIIILGVLIIMCGGLYVGVSYSKLAADTVSSNPIETGAWAAYFNNAKTIRQVNIDDRDITGPVISYNSTEMYVDVMLNPNSEYVFSLDLHNQSTVPLKIIDIYKRIIRSSDNEISTTPSLKFKTTYADGTPVNIDDTLRAHEVRKIIFTIETDNNIARGNYKFEFNISNQFIK
jgi:hypothetical protein